MKITLTGVDEKTDIQQIIRLCDKFEHAEFAFLYSATPNNGHRYPSREFIVRAVAAIGGERCAIHVCGSAARQELAEGKLTYLTSHFSRVQANGIFYPRLAEEFAFRVYPAILITQFHEKNLPMLDVVAHNHCLLVDASGGRGILPEWKLPYTRKTVGFAGGLNQKNIKEELGKIIKIMSPQRVEQSDWWVDLETGLRDDSDWFCIKKAEAVLTAHKEFINETVK